MAAILAGCGVLLYLLGVAAGRDETGMWLLVVAVIALGLALASAIWAGVEWLRRRSVRKQLNAYACSRCGYAPSLEDLESEESIPCPRCGQPVYDEE